VNLVLTPGMGIGPEVTARALAELTLDAAVTLFGDGLSICRALDEAGVEYIQSDYGSSALPGVCVVDCRGAEPAPVVAIRRAAEACLNGHADAMITGPIHKAQLIEHGFTFMGHTDMLGSLCGADPVMAFAGGSIRVALVTTHIPLSSVPAAISKERVRRVVETAESALQADLGISTPRIALCGLNPHAGEGGALGTTEVDVLEPLADVLRSEGVALVGPISAETAFMDAQAGHFDLVVAMYHDQGLVPLKVLDFGRSVNWTLGLPIVRTSVDHGTADALVGTGRADHASMMAAIQLAIDIVQRRSAVSSGSLVSSDSGISRTSSHS
jgi:4-hydroxythreonine-4-phosphate dehydrogenase